MKTFKEIETELSSLKSTNLADVEKYQGNIVKANQALKIANEKLTTAEETADGCQHHNWQNLPNLPN